MGILDFFRRTASAPTLGTEVRAGQLSDTAQESDASRTSPLTAIAPPDESESAAPVGSYTPQAWSLMAPIATVAQRSMQPSFDTGVAGKLRTLRGPNDVFLSTTLSHTVNRKSSGIVDGLVTQSTASVGFTPWQTGADQILRRKYPTAAELPALDSAHHRWPILSRFSAVSSLPSKEPTSLPSLAPSSIGSSLISDGNATTARVRLEPDTNSLNPPVVRRESDTAQQVDRSVTEPLTRSSGVDEKSAEVTPTEIATVGLVGSPVQRSLSLVSPAASLVRLPPTEPATITPAFAAPVINRNPASGYDEPKTLRSETPQILRSTLSVPTAIFRDTAPENSQRSLVPPSPALSIGEFTSIRRRSIIEMPSSNSSNPTSFAGEQSSELDLSDPSVRSSDLLVRTANPTSSLNESATISRTPNDSESSEIVDTTSEESAPPRPTLGRRAGLGEPMSAVPASALEALSGSGVSESPFAGWNDAAPDLPLIEPAVSSDDGISERSSPVSNRPSSMLSRIADEPAEQGSRQVLDPIAQSVEVGRPNVLLRVVGGIAPFDASRQHEVDAAMSLSLPVPNRPLLGSQSLLRVSAESPSALPMLASSIPASDPGATPPAVPIQRMFASPHIARSSAQHQGDRGSAIGVEESNRYSGNETESLSAQSDEQGTDSFAPVSPRELHRVSDSDSLADTPLAQTGAPNSGLSSPSSLITRSDLNRINGVSITGLTGAIARQPSVEHVSLVNRLSPSVSGVLFQRTASENNGRVKGAYQPSNGGLALLERAVARSSSDAGSPSSSGSAGVLWPGGPSGDATLRPDRAGREDLIRREDEVSPESTTSEDNYSSQNEVGPETSNEAASPEPSAGAATAGATATGSSAQAETDVEMLAGRIYDRIRNRLRRELLDDRERAGLTLDRVR
jgi:hypothetical protein